MTDILTVNHLVDHVPARLDRGSVWEALAPLFTLLGITPDDFYSEPGLTITRDEITFSIPAHLPPLILGYDGHRIKEAEARIVVALSPEDFAVSKTAEEYHRDALREAEQQGRLADLVRSGWTHLTGAGDCYFCGTADVELAATYGTWNACQRCFVKILPKCQP